MPDVKPRMPSWADEEEAAPDLPPPIVLEAGEVLDKYKLVRPLAAGGMAHVWVAKNLATGAELALKVLLEDAPQLPEASARFRREAHAASRLRHRAIVRVFDLVEVPGAMVIVMELLHGETLGARLDREGKLDVADAAEVLLPILSALSHAHQVGIVHRDLKPDNIFLAREPDGEIIPKLLDFGISKLERASLPVITTDGNPLGTPGYMSPEQVRGAGDATPASDVFTMGTLLHRTLSGKNPFADESYHSVVAAILERDAPAIPGLPGPVHDVLERCLAKEPGDRYANAGELKRALESALLDANVPFDPPSQRVSLPRSSPGVPPSRAAGDASPARAEATNASAPPASLPAPVQSTAIVRGVLAVVALAAVLVVAYVASRRPGGPPDPGGSARDQPAPSASTAPGSVTPTPPPRASSMLENPGH